MVGVTRFFPWQLQHATNKNVVSPDWTTRVPWTVIPYDVISHVKGGTRLESSQEVAGAHLAISFQDKSLLASGEAKFL